MLPKLILVNSTFLSNNNLLFLSSYHVPRTAVDPVSKCIICKSNDVVNLSLDYIKHTYTGESKKNSVFPI